MIAIVVAFLVGAGILLVFLGIANSGSSAGISARLERYAAGNVQATTTQTTSSPTSLGDLMAQSVALARLNRVVEQRDFGANLAREIARADLKLKPGEYMVLWASMIIGIPFAFLILGFAFPVLKSPFALLLGGVVGFFIPRFWIKRRQNSRLNAFNKQLPDTITLIANSLRAGSSFLQAIEMVVREAQPPISLEFGRVVREVNLGLAFDAALENMVRRVRSDDLELMATAITIQHQVGGNLAEILDSIAFTIRERVRIKGEIRTLTAQQRMSGYVVGFLPLGLMGAISLLDPTFMSPMFENPPAFMGLPAGVVLLTVGGISMAIGFMLIRKIVAIEV